MGVDAGRGQLHIGPHARRGFAVVRGVDGPGRPGPAVRGDERFGPGVRAPHVHDPFAAAPHVLLAQAAVRVQHALDLGVDPALELVRGGRHPSVLRQRGVAEREQHAPPVEPDEPEVGAAQPLVRVPPCF